MRLLAVSRLADRGYICDAPHALPTASASTSVSPSMSSSASQSTSMSPSQTMSASALSTGSETSMSQSGSGTKSVAVALAVRVAEPEHLVHLLRIINAVGDALSIAVEHADAVADALIGPDCQSDCESLGHRLADPVTHEVGDAEAL